MNEQEILAKCVRVYANAVQFYLKSLRKQKRYAQVKKLVPLSKITSIEDAENFDKKLRTLEVYNPKRPNNVASFGFYPMLGLTLELVHMSWFRVMEDEVLTDYYKHITKGMTFLGEFAEFCYCVEGFKRELSNNEIYDVNIDLPFHEI